MVTVLDKANKIEEIDKSNMLNDLVNTPNYCLDAMQRANQVNVPKGLNPKNVVLVGMGGSAIGGEILKDWLRDVLTIPVEVCRDYFLPAYVNKDSLVFVNSYSGNTEETLSAFSSAVQRNCTLLAITSGGKLENLCIKLQVPYVKIPSGLQPRVGIPYMFFPLPVLMEKAGLLTNVAAELNEAIAVLEQVCKTIAPDVPTKDNHAKQLATKLVGAIPVVYGFGQYGSVAHRLKAQFNENSKVHSRFDVFPELNHNETVGYEAPEFLNEKHSVILIRDHQESPEIRARIETTTKFVFSRAKNVLTLQVSGEGKLAKMFSVLYTGDFASVYLAILQGIDPTPVTIIDTIKSELATKKQQSRNV
ncbi:MAG: bifunctional phosphoglucose/phosphomannose isomerase [Candidatus Bathyarchaeota archaeon]|nr:bifunctional phosphoglucose/phosphomannose isomerase [Candidatus Bathyarchaeum sp.]